MFKLLPELQKQKELSPTISGFFATADLRKSYWGNGERLSLPKGWVKVEKQDPKPMWALIASKGIEAKVLIGVNDAGEIEVLPRFAIVRKADQATLQPPAPTGGALYETEAQRAAREKEAGILRHARRLAVGPFTGTAFEGRAYWSRDSWYDRPEATTIDGVEGTLVTVRIFVTDEEVKSQRAAGEAEYQAELVARAAEDASG